MSLQRISDSSVQVLEKTCHLCHAVMNLFVRLSQSCNVLGQNEVILLQPTLSCVQLGEALFKGIGLLLISLCEACRCSAGCDSSIADDGGKRACQAFFVCTALCPAHFKHESFQLLHPLLEVLIPCCCGNLIRNLHDVCSERFHLLLHAINLLTGGSCKPFDHGPAVCLAVLYLSGNMGDLLLHCLVAGFQGSQPFHANFCLKLAQRGLLSSHLKPDGGQITHERQRLLTNQP
mmetsp:Transcript_32255/g.74477  ORF Transcript_32255/g.74477 Transcript_32255/m.74477 type:complete len:233 (+) Transcript_32255:343-1041(+)